MSTRNLTRTLLLAAALMVALAPTSNAATPLFSSFVGPYQPIKVSGLGTCSTARDGEVFLVTNATSSSVCTGTGTSAAVCICDEDAWRSIGGEVAPTATALEANGANCSAGSYPLGVDASGAAESCTATPQDPTRTIRVDAELSAVAGKVYNTVTAALAYVATQSPSEASPWIVNVYGQSFTESGAMTLPIGTHLKCHNGGGIYFGGSATTIQATMTSGTFLTVEGGSITNCIIQQNGTPTGARTVVSLVAQSTLDHVGVVANGGNNSQTVIGIDATPPSGFIVYTLYYVNVSFAGDNANAIGIRLGVGGFLAFDNGIVSGGGGAGSNGKALQVLTDSPGYAQVKNVSFGSTYAQTSDWTLDISEEGTGSVFVGLSRYNATSGTITDWSRPSIPYQAAPPFTCDAAAVAGGSTRQYVDTTGSDLCTCMGAGGWATADGSGTCD